MKVKIEIATLEESILVGLVERSMREYLSDYSDVEIRLEDIRMRISEQIEQLKELELISFYTVSSYVSLDSQKKEVS